MMSVKKLDEAISEAERFIKRAKANRKLASTKDYGNFTVENFQPRENAATKRSAIDLGHALAKLNAR